MTTTNPQDQPGGASHCDEHPFVLKPTIQLGASFGKDSNCALEISWITHVQRKFWSVQVKELSRSRWAELKVKKVDDFIFAGKKLRRLRARLSAVSIGSAFDYRILLNGKVVFEAQSKAALVGNTPHRVAVVGDVADGSPEAHAVVKAIAATNPDLTVLAGDVVYENGLLSEYRQNFDAVFNGESPDGVPLARSTLFVAAAGNHDVRVPSPKDAVLAQGDSDLFAYFRVWRHVQNGPTLKAKTIETMVQGGKHGPRLLEVIGPGFVQMSNFWFDIGDTRWLVLDANDYMDWRDEELQKWLRKALKSARSKRWKFVCFHQPGFSSDAKYKKDTRMRVLAPIFEEFGVDVVFSGHGHFYERHRPLQFRLAKGRAGQRLRPQGETTLDITYDGRKHNRPVGVIYVVTGAGGTLTTPRMRPTITGLSESTAKVVDDRQSFTVLDVAGRLLTVRQLDVDGKEVDHFVIDKR